METFQAIEIGPDRPSVSQDMNARINLGVNDENTRTAEPASVGDKSESSNDRNPDHSPIEEVNIEVEGAVPNTYREQVAETSETPIVQLTDQDEGKEKETQKLTQQSDPESGLVREPPPTKSGAGEGISINRKYIALAGVSELALITASLYGALLFARKYGTDDFDTQAMMMLAPIIFAVAELMRIPLAIALRSQDKIGMKVILVLALVAAVCVSVKSYSQLAEQTFHPRLHDVAINKERVDASERSRNSMSDRIRIDDQEIAALRAEQQQVQNNSMAVAGQMGNVAKPKCWTVIRTNSKNKRYTTRQCSNDPLGDTIRQNLNKSNSNYDDVTAKLDAARSKRSELDLSAYDAAVDKAKTDYRLAIERSQLHSFTAMVFGKSPAEVSEAEIHWFLRLFVFLPSICAACASTFLALAAVKKDKPKDDDSSIGTEGMFEIVTVVTDAVVRGIGMPLDKLHRVGEDAGNKAADNLPHDAPKQPGIEILRPTRRARPAGQRPLAQTR